MIPATTNNGRPPHSPPGFLRTPRTTRSPSGGVNSAILRCFMHRKLSMNVPDKTVNHLDAQPQTYSPPESGDADAIGDPATTTYYLPSVTFPGWYPHHLFNFPFDGPESLVLTGSAACPTSCDRFESYERVGLNARGGHDGGRHW